MSGELEEEAELGEEKEVKIELWEELAASMMMTVPSVELTSIDTDVVFVGPILTS